jgi:hypothetical protein
MTTVLDAEALRAELAGLATRARWGGALIVSYQWGNFFGQWCLVREWGRIARARWTDADGGLCHGSRSARGAGLSAARERAARLLRAVGGPEGGWRKAVAAFARCLRV